MSSRILQENSSLLLTENNEPLINDNFISTEGFVTGSPIVSDLNMAEEETFLADSIATNQPSVSATDFLQDNILSADNVLTLLPVLSLTTIEQNHALLSTPIVTQSPISTEPFYDAALLRIVSITADSSNTAVIQEVDGNIVTLSRSINQQSISRSINEVA